MEVNNRLQAPMSIWRKRAPVWERYRLPLETPPDGVSRGESTLSGEGKVPVALMRKLVTIVDGFERILELADANNAAAEDPILDNWLKSIRGLYRRLSGILEREGLEAVPSLGRKVDFHVHEVEAVEEDPQLPPRTVVRESARGYHYGGRLLRPAKVIVTPVQATTGTMEGSA